MDERPLGAGADLPGHSAPALVASNAVLGEDVTVGPGSVVGREDAEPVTLGAGTAIGRGVVIEPGVSIGEEVVVGDGCTIGAGARIAAGTRLAPGLHVARISGHVGPVPRDDAQPKPSPGTGGAISPQALVAKNVMLGKGVEIGPFAVVGWDGEEPVRIGARTKISPYALIEPGARIGSDCDVDAYCRVGFRSTVGDESKVLYGAAIFEEVSIGRACIVGGDVADRTVLEDFVTYFGEVAHDYRHPGDLADWDGKPTKSPTIRCRSIVSQNAIIVGGRDIGPSSYVSAGEVVGVTVPEGMLFQRGRMIEISKTRGLVRTRRDGLDE